MLNINALKVSGAQRNSNIEILRMLAMFMVLILHANFLVTYPSAGGETSADLVRVAVQSVCIVAVNVFVFISGWYRIRPTYVGFFKFMYQVAFFVGILILAQVIISSEIPNPLMVFGLFNGGGWFVASYIGLYLLSPVLNSYVESHSRKQLLYLTAAFFVFQTLWGMSLSVKFFQMGYSTISFIGLYLLAQLIKQYRHTKISRWGYLCIFVICAIANTILFILASRLRIIPVKDLILGYINPIVIVQSVSLFMVFISLPVRYSHKINRVASSCFAVYLFHVGTPWALSVYLSCCQRIALGGVIS